MLQSLSAMIYAKATVNTRILIMITAAATIQALTITITIITTITIRITMGTIQITAGTAAPAVRTVAGAAAQMEAEIKRRCPNVILK
ncbi:hypothetical protein [Cohnella cholangitidis]|uniref:Uncharacterized protein n=1 Tax=Cohnella cholangitidis TaxID=2598458 RepID=A0A7G5C2C1_9BACL|nr:hypothetical protein [Cohnella cholangitidis]QMV43355.1 hypothetical protein FPL14_20900 [Cohnella cholangitidis]